MPTHHSRSLKTFLEGTQWRQDINVSGADWSRTPHGHTFLLHCLTPAGGRAGDTTQKRSSESDRWTLGYEGFSCRVLHFLLTGSVLSSFSTPRTGMRQSVSWQRRMTGTFDLLLVARDEVPASSRPALGSSPRDKRQVVARPINAHFQGTRSGRVSVARRPGKKPRSVTAN